MVIDEIAFDKTERLWFVRIGGLLNYKPTLTACVALIMCWRQRGFDITSDDVEINDCFLRDKIELNLPIVGKDVTEFIRRKQIVT